jgi:hypothetical protein
MWMMKYPQLNLLHLILTFQSLSFGYPKSIIAAGSADGVRFLEVDSVVGGKGTLYTHALIAYV